MILLIFTYGINLLCVFYVFYYLLFERKSYIKPYFIRQYEKILDKTLERNSIFKKIISNINGIIARSGVRKPLLFFNVNIFLGFSFVLLIIGFALFRKFGFYRDFIWICYFLLALCYFDAFCCL